MTWLRLEIGNKQTFQYCKTNARIEEGGLINENEYEDIWLDVRAGEMTEMCFKMSKMCSYALFLICAYAVLHICAFAN